MPVELNRGYSGYSIDTTSNGRANLQLQGHDFIHSKKELWQEVARGGPIELFSDAASIYRDFVNAMRENLAFKIDPVYDGVGLPRGDGSIVDVIGGFGSSRFHYLDTKRSLSRINYNVVLLPWGCANTESPSVMAPIMMPIVEQQRRETGKKINLLVHSLGGYDAAAMFAMYPERFVDSVKHVVFVGSPRPERLNKALALSYLVLHMFEADDEFEMAEKLDLLDQVVSSGLLKVSSIDSSADPVVSGQHLAKDKDHYVIDRASHSALLMQKHAMRAIAHVLVGEEVDERRYPNIHHPRTTSQVAA